MYLERRSKSEHKILTYEGRSLCSRIAPIKEANRWAESIRPSIADTQQVIFLGLGSGYRLSALVNTYSEKKITVIETQQEPINFFKETFPDNLRKIEIYRVDKDNSYEVALREIKLQTSNFRVLKDYSSQLVDAELYKQIELFLLGRNELGMIWHLKNRSELRGAICLRPVRPGLLSINDLYVSRSSTETGTTEAGFSEATLKFLILKELVN